MPPDLSCFFGGALYCGELNIGSPSSRETIIVAPSGFILLGGNVYTEYRPVQIAKENQNTTAAPRMKNTTRNFLITSCLSGVGNLSC